jgi:hypothetical protein
VAFASLTSTSAAGSIAAYGIVGFGRAFVTRKTFQPSFWDLGKFGVVMAIVTFVWNGFAFAVLCAPQYSDNAIGQNAAFFNFTIVIMAGITVIALPIWWQKSKDVWFSNLKDIDNISQHTQEDVRQVEKRYLPTPLSATV